MSITITAHGTPKGQPRPKAFSRGGHARIYDPGTAEGWKGQIALAARGLIPAPLEGPLAVTMQFAMPRPKSHYTKAGLRTSAPKYHTGTPDADNLAKAVMDALTQLSAWRDDSQVAVLAVCKRYTAFDGQPAGVVIQIENLPI
jgi:Holliday junction resolvase RusA-like endonuclease